MASALVLVGWDEIKCRPIYQRQSQAVAVPKVKKSRTAQQYRQDAPTALVSGEEGVLSSLASASVKNRQCKHPQVGTTPKRQKVRTVSLSPVEDGKRVRRGADNDNAIGVDENAADGEAIDIARGSISFGTANISNKRKRKKFYGSRATVSNNVAAGSLGSEKYHDVNFSASIGNRKGVDSPAKQDFSLLKENSEGKAELERNVGTNDIAPVHAGRIAVSDASIQSKPPCSPSPNTSFNNQFESEKATLPSDKEISTDASIRSASSFSTNSNATLGSYQLDDKLVGERGQLPINGNAGSDVGGYESINLGQSMEHDVPVASPMSTPSNVTRHKSSLSPIGAKFAIDTLDSGIGPIALTSPAFDPMNNASLTSGESTASANIPEPSDSIDGTPNHSGIGQHQLSLRERASTAADSTKDSPLEKYQDGFNSPHVYERRDANTNEFEEIDFVLDGPESHAHLNHYRRSYGDVKPVWMSNKHAAANAGSTDEASKIIGWDDAKCRPVYQAPPARKKAETQNNPSCNSPANTNGKPFASSNNPSDSDGSHFPNKTTQKKRVYTSLFKRPGLSQAARDRMDVGSPSAACFSAARRAQSAAESIADHPCRDGNIGIRDDNDKPNVDGPDQRSDSLLDVDSELEAIMNDSNAPHPQPTSKSSLESARAFFRYLDSNHKLTILNQCKGEHFLYQAGD